MPATISPSQRPTSAVVSSSRLTNQNLIYAKLVSIRDKLVKDKNRGELYFSTAMSHKNPFTTRNQPQFLQNWLWGVTIIGTKSCAKYPRATPLISTKS